jgi:hypothetical protein
MPDRRIAHSRLTLATLRRIVALALARTFGYGRRTMAAPGLVATAPDEHSNHRPGI